MINQSFKHNNLLHFLSKPYKCLLRSISKEKYVKKEYRYITGHKLNLDNPKRYTEKLQHLRLYEYANNESVSVLASKVCIKEYLEEHNLSSNIIPTIGIYNKFSDIDFNKLPNKFVLKCTHASGFNFICFDKSKINIHKLKKQFNKWLKTDYGKVNVEPHYSNIKPQIICEELLLENNKLPTEYKIHVFNGKAKYLYVVKNRNNGITYNNFTIDWVPFDEAQFNNWTSTDKHIEKPQNFNKMIEISELLAENFPFVRVDLYSIENKIFVSELTFTPAKGTLKFKDDNVDYLIGNWLTISK